jgi:hypothetical protein
MPAPPEVRLVAIAASLLAGPGQFSLYALDSTGRLWAFRHESGWVRIPGPTGP